MPIRPTIAHRTADPAAESGQARTRAGNGSLLPPLQAMMQLQKSLGNQAVLQLMGKKDEESDTRKPATKRKKSKDADDSEQKKKKKKVIKSKKLSEEERREQNSAAAKRRLEQKKAFFKRVKAKLNQGLTGSKWENSNVSLSAGEIHKVPVKFADTAEKNAGSDQEHVSVNDLYNNNAVSLIPPKSYENNRTDQVLRWISSAFYFKLKGKTQEVQAGLFDDDRFYLAANENQNKKHFVRKNKKQEVDETGLSTKELLGNIVREYEKTGAEKFPKMLPEVKERVVRHLEKIKARLLQDELPEEYAHLSDALDAKPIVAMAAEKANGKKVDLHAERRIKKYLNDDAKFRAGHVKGLKRPCLICMMANYGEYKAGNDDWMDKCPHIPERSGPGWLSEAATYGYDIEANADTINRLIPRTYASIPKSEKEKMDQDPDYVPKFSYNIDTDSESDVDESELEDEMDEEDEDERRAAAGEEEILLMEEDEQIFFMDEEEQGFTMGEEEQGFLEDEDEMELGFLADDEEEDDMRG
ncbi:hypothetical protein [Paenibacillus oleatilyticus]|uniref:hypothetical protein n=1 Tax=Paenibacillus oleatilyticus TaxID=2594886 RepID=UPI001C1FDB44|nr:hypothetical protein [Paenibacillus oleatilyticus]MBU7314197.1 hypothetical protein [Paenibacillus oleatilyticus]